MATIGIAQGRHAREHGTAARVLVAIELATGAAALAGGLLLAVEPDGSLLQARSSALENGPFGDWRVPGVLLAVLVGGGFLGAAWWQHRRRPFARELSMLAGAGLVVFEGFELLWIGAQPLEGVFAVVGLTVLALAVRLPRGSGG
jgi:hypothetical protein